MFNKHRLNTDVDEYVASYYYSLLRRITYQNEQLSGKRIKVHSWHETTNDSKQLWLTLTRKMNEKVSLYRKLYRKALHLSGEEVYAMYCGATNGISIVSKLPMTEWHEMTDKQRSCWNRMVAHYNTDTDFNCKMICGNDYVNNC